MQGREEGRKELHQETSVEDSVLNGQNALPPVTGQSEDTVGGRTVGEENEVTSRR